MTSPLEAQLALQLRALKFPEPEREYRFASPRRWRFDFAWPSVRLAVECEGGTYTHGRHTRGNGFQGDCTKLNRAALDGWRVLRFTRQDIQSGAAIAAIEEGLKNNFGNA